ncbi:cryptochrome/photolyase family protein [Nostoc sp. FACHB-133]|nr:cryptochrome/photolyase family protein [Nostoc sp. FACHB-133]
MTGFLLSSSKFCHARQKLVLLWSAMRHFAAELLSEGWAVTYT